MSKQKTIAVMIDPDWSLKRHQEVIAGIRKYNREHANWKLVSDLYPESVLERYDAVIGRVTPGLADKARKAGVPVVNTWISSEARNVPFVIPDVAAIASTAADHLIARGFRNFGFMGFANKSARLLRNAFVEYLNEQRFSCSSILLSENYTAGPKQWRRFTDRIESWVDTLEIPVAVLTATDIISHNLVSAFEYRNIMIPQQGAIIGVDNEPNICLRDTPSLSSIDLGWEAIGYKAAELLHSIKKGRKPPLEPITFPPDYLVARKSTDAYVVDDPLMAEALRFIAEHSHEPIKVSDVAKGVNVTRRTLERRFKDNGERSVAREISYFRVQRLKRLLMQTNRPIKYLANEVGFKDASQMYIVFKRLTGIAPIEFRKRNVKTNRS